MNCRKAYYRNSYLFVTDLNLELESLDSLLVSLILAEMQLLQT